MSRADLHCHSTASQLSKLRVQRGAGIPECATPPAEVYELAKRRGMDFVTITDHDTIEGVLEIAHLPDVFISEELTVSFAGEPQAVHVLCFGITPDDHEWLQRHNGDVEACAEYLQANDVGCALAHPFYSVAAPLQPRHRRRLAELFGTWETRNGSRARELNLPAAVYVGTHGGTATGGSGDHAGVDVGRTYTETPPARTPEEFLVHLRAGRARPGGAEGSAAKWAHSAIAIAARTFPIERDEPPPSPGAVLGVIERIVGEGRGRGSAGESGSEAANQISEAAARFTADDARALLAAWLESVGAADGRELIELMQADDFSHGDLLRRARHVHESKLRAAAAALADRLESGDEQPPVAEALAGFFDASLPVVPYAPAIAFLGGERRRLDASSAGRREEPLRVALVVDAIDAPHGVSHTIQRLREHGVPGFEVDVVGTDRGVDRRLPAATELDVPFYEGMRVGIPELPGLVEALSDGRYDLIHVATPGPAGAAAALIARMSRTPLVGSHHTELVDYARMRSGSDAIAATTATAMGLLYGECGVVLSPSSAADGSLVSLGVEPERIARWVRGVDVELFSPGRPPLPEARRAGRIAVLYAGRLTREKGIDLLADAFALARRRMPELHLLLAGDGPERELILDRLGSSAQWLGWLEDERLARAYASADAFLFPSQTDTYGQVVVEAQAAGLPVIAVRRGGLPI